MNKNINYLADAAYLTYTSIAFVGVTRTCEGFQATDPLKYRHGLKADPTSVDLHVLDWQQGSRGRSGVAGDGPAGRSYRE